MTPAGWMRAKSFPTAGVITLPSKPITKLSPRFSRFGGMLFGAMLVDLLFEFCQQVHGFERSEAVEIDVAEAVENFVRKGCEDCELPW